VLLIQRVFCADRTGGHLWEFIRRLLSLSDADSERIIQWENKSEGVFRFLDPDAVATRWGEQKHNRRTAMDYPKLSRALRYGTVLPRVSLVSVALCTDTHAAFLPLIIITVIVLFFFIIIILFARIFKCHCNNINSQ